MSTIDDATRQHVQSVKDLLNVRRYAQERLGISIDKEDKSSCFMHSGDREPSLHFYSNGYFCFGCEAHGDFIALFQHFYPDAGFLAAIDDGSEFVGMQPCPRREWTKEDYVAYKADRDELKLISDIYLSTAKYFQENLAENSYARQDIQDRWGLEEWFCEKKRVGYAPVDRGALFSHLTGLDFKEEQIFKSGLVKRTERGDLNPVFRGRIVFPYWVGARIAYFIGRSTPDTPDLYAGKDEAGEVIWRDPPKYKKLPVYRPDKDGNISHHVQNVLYGMDFLHDARYEDIVITEGIADAMKAEQHGIPVVSPVTVRLKRADFERHIELFKKKRRIYIINDNEENRSGERGAMDIADMLEAAGCSVRIAIIPRPEGVDKVDLADVMRDAEDPKEVIDALKKSSRPPLLHKILSIDPDADEMERNEQILSHKASWASVMAAQLPVMMDVIQKHFGMKARQRNAIETSIKKIIKEEEKRRKDEADRDEAANRQNNIQNMRLKDRIMFELESTDSGMSSAERISRWVTDWFRDDEAKFYYLKDHDVGIVYFRRKLLQEGTTGYYVMMDEHTGLNRRFKIHQAILEYIRLAIIRDGAPIQALSWITTKDGVKYYNLSGEANDTLICIDPAKRDVEVVPNGNNKHGLLLGSPIRMNPFEYDPGVDVAEGMRLFEDLIFRNMTCSTRDKYLVTAWNFLPFFVDSIGTRPILQFNGSASSGKTTTAKMLSTLLYGEARHEFGSTIAAIYDVSANSPCIYWDNKEAKNTREDEIEFLIAAATRARRQKKGSAGVGDVVQQEPQSMVLSTGIELFNRNELISRTLFVTFDEMYQREGFSEERVLRSIKKHRNIILSAMIKIVHRVTSSLIDDEMQDLIEDRIRRDYPDNAKKRNMSAFIHMWAALEEVCKHIRHSYSYYDMGGNEVADREVRFENNPSMPHHDVFGSWVFSQNATHFDVNTGSNNILYFLCTLKKIWDNKDLGDGDWDEHQEQRIREFLDLYQIRFYEHQGVQFLLCSYPDLHYAFSKIANPSVPYDISDPNNLRVRVKDAKKILKKGGWAVGPNVRRSKSQRRHLFVPLGSSGDLVTLEEKYGHIKWLDEDKLALVQ